MALLSLSFVNVIALSAIASVSYVVLSIFYNLFLHPLRKYPGPLLCRSMRLYMCYLNMSGVLHWRMLEMHRKYGPIVRIAPNELAFSDSRSWRDMSGHRTGSDGRGDLDKYMPFYRAIPVEIIPDSVTSEDREMHSTVRRMMANGFSEKSMRDQQPFIRKYIDLLIKRLHEIGAGGSKAVDIMSWYNFTTFDVIGDLAFAEPFGCLDGSGYHPWVKSIFEHVKVGTILQTLGYWPGLKSMLFNLTPAEARKQHQELTLAKTRKRIEIGAERPDLMHGLLKENKDGFKLSEEKIDSNAGILIIAGSETTATLLSGVTYLLLTNPHTMEKLVHEIRSAFKSEDEIELNSVNSLSYMLACLEEAFRFYPPAPVGLPRVTPKQGAHIGDEFIPGNTIVALHQYAAYRLEENFALPNEYRPERWLGDPKFANDDRAVFNPFSLGPRNCIGRNLAYIEMRLILSRILWNFDLKLADDSQGWIQRQKAFIMWNKPPLNVYLKPVVRA
ncbi:unnamed protein product [Discula destructiva]